MNPNSQRWGILDTCVGQTCPLRVNRYRPIEPTAPPDVGCCSKTGHGFASQRNVDRCQ